jgi:hypothetical protein
MSAFGRLPGYAQNDEPSIRAQLDGGKPPFIETVQPSLTVAQAARARRIAAEPFSEPVT